MIGYYALVLYISVISSICSIFELHISLVLSETWWNMVKFWHVRIKIKIKILNQNPYSLKISPNSKLCCSDADFTPLEFKMLTIQEHRVDQLDFKICTNVTINMLKIISCIVSKSLSCHTNQTQGQTIAFCFFFQFSNHGLLIFW